MTMRQPHAIDELLDRAVQAINSGDRATASALAEQVLTLDSANRDAEDLLAAPAAGTDEMRRLTILFADVVDSTALSTRVEPETYYTVIERYRRQVKEIVNRYEGHIFSTKGDGLLAVFGHPKAHENDVRRAVQAGLDITRDVAALSERVRTRFGFDISVRVGVHRGLVYLDVAHDDVYGLGANLASRVSGLAPPGSVVVSEAIAPLVRDYFELEFRPAQPVKGVDEPVEHYQVVGERVMLTRIPLGPLVGRDRELAYLRSAWTDAENGSLSTPGVGFVGEAGMGKSRLATVVADLAEQSGRPVLALIGSPFHTDAGLYPVRALLEQRCGIERSTEQAERLRLLENEVRARGLDPESTVPLLAPVLGIAAEHGYQPARTEGARLYEQIIDAIVGYLFARIGEGTAVVLAEDLQWFDPSTLKVVESLLRTSTGRLLVVLTGRDIASFPNIPALKTFQLAPLTTAETDELITALDPTLSDDDRSEVARRCDGVPLYLEEVVTKLHEQPTDAARWVRVPDALYEPLFSRLRASDTTIQVVEAAATIGREFDRDTLCSVLDMTEAELDAAIRGLEAVLVFEPRAVDSWRFRHELLREVAYELPPPSVARILHGRVADVLVGNSDHADWHVVALHYEHAERFGEAANAHQQAAHDARCRGALDEARECLTRAIAQVEHVTPGPTRDRRETRLRLRRGFLTYAAEGASSPNAAADFERCLELSGRDLGDTDFFSTLVALYGYYAMRADLDRLERLLSSLRVALTGTREGLRPSNDAAFGMLAWYRGEFDRARVNLESAATFYDEPAKGAQELEAVWFMPNDATASIYTHLALARSTHGDLAGADAELLRTKRRCEQLPFPQGPFSLAYAHQIEVLIRIEAGQLECAADVASDLVRLGAQHGFDSWALVGAAQQETVKALSALTENPGDMAALRAHIVSITGFVDLWRALGMISLITFYDAVLVRLHLATNQIEEARQRLRTALGLADETGMHFYDAELLRLRAYTAGDIDSQRADLSSAIELAHGQDAHIFELRSAADNFELSGERGRQMLVDAISRFPDGSTWPELARARALVE
jgi:class 3 adenylate cyclase/predicted ATPase